MRAQNVQERRNIMNLCRCENGHFYDKEKYPTCPHCSGGSAIDGKPTEAWDDGPTVPMNENPPKVQPNVQSTRSYFTVDILNTSENPTPILNLFNPIFFTHSRLNSYEKFNEERKTSFFRSINRSE